MVKMAICFPAFLWIKSLSVKFNGKSKVPASIERPNNITILKEPMFDKIDTTIYEVTRKIIVFKLFNVYNTSFTSSLSFHLARIYQQKGVLTRRIINNLIFSCFFMFFSYFFMFFSRALPNPLFSEDIKKRLQFSCNLFKFLKVIHIIFDFF